MRTLNRLPTAALPHLDSFNHKLMSHSSSYVFSLNAALAFALCASSVFSLVDDLILLPHAQARAARTPVNDASSALMACLQRIQGNDPQSKALYDALCDLRESTHLHVTGLRYEHSTSGWDEKTWEGYLIDGKHVFSLEDQKYGG